ncbi:GHKL domain-containing protein [bacterium]|nr:GHKL domain-containing protein [bacterium]
MVLDTPLRQMHLQVSVLPLEDEENRFSGTLLLFTDITDLKENEATRRRSERLETLANLSATMAHEIRNPLNSLGIHIQLLERELKRQGVSLGYHDNLHVLKEEVTRLNQVLENFLSAVRPERARLVRISLFEVVQSALRLLEPEIVAAGVRVDVFSPYDWPDVAGDEEKLRRAFINLIRNALEAMPAGGELAIRLEQGEDHVTLCFDDTGEGIPPEALDKVFEPYFTTKARGTGLGLFMVRNVIEEHRGEVEIESRPGAGTSVRVTLPVVEREGILIPEKTSEARDG